MIKFSLPRVAKELAHYFESDKWRLIYPVFPHKPNSWRGKGLLYRRTPANRCRRNDRSRKPPFVNSQAPLTNEKMDLGDNHHWKLKSLEKDRGDLFLTDPRMKAPGWWSLTPVKVRWPDIACLLHETVGSTQRHLENILTKRYEP